MMVRKFRLPDGTLTTDSVCYTNAWQDLAKPLAEITESRLIGYDPGLLFQSKDNEDYQWGIGLKIAKLILAALPKKTP